MSNSTDQLSGTTRTVPARRAGGASRERTTCGDLPPPPVPPFLSRSAISTDSQSQSMEHSVNSPLFSSQNSRSRPLDVASSYSGQTTPSSQPHEQPPNRRRSGSNPLSSQHSLARPLEEATYPGDFSQQQHSPFASSPSQPASPVSSGPFMPPAYLALHQELRRAQSLDRILSDLPPSPSPSSSPTGSVLSLARPLEEALYPGDASWPPSPTASPPHSGDSPPRSLLVDALADSATRGVISARPSASQISLARPLEGAQYPESTTPPSRHSGSPRRSLLIEPVSDLGSQSASDSQISLARPLEEVPLVRESDLPQSALRRARPNRPHPMALSGDSDATPWSRLARDANEHVHRLPAGIVHLPAPGGPRSGSPESCPQRPNATGPWNRPGRGNQGNFRSGSSSPEPAFLPPPPDPCPLDLYQPGNVGNNSRAASTLSQFADVSASASAAPPPRRTDAAHGLARARGAQEEADRNVVQRVERVTVQRPQPLPRVQAGDGGEMQTDPGRERVNRWLELTEPPVRPRGG